MAKRRQTAPTAPETVDNPEDTVANGETTGAETEAPKKKTRSAFYIVVATDEGGAIGEALWQGKSRRSAEKFINDCNALLRRTVKAVAILRVKPMGVVIL